MLLSIPRKRDTSVPGDFQKKKKKKLAARRNSRAQVPNHRPQTTDHHPPLSGINTPPPESTYLLLHRGSLAAAHIPRKLSFLSFVGSHVFGKIPFLWQRWTAIRTLHPILRTRTVRCLRRRLSCAPSAMRSCAPLSHVLMATAMSGIEDFFFFFENPRGRRCPASSGSIISKIDFCFRLEICLSK